jgi:hypothetical protein
MGVNQPVQRKEISVAGIFARHETFHPRFGWIKKGYDAIDEDAEVFLKDDPHIQLGVGKNMAQAIRYWCSAFKVVEARMSDDRRVRGYIPSDFGRRLMKDDGWDPWLEDPASLWLLHWNLLKYSCQATAWHFAFNEFRRAEFTFDELYSELRAYCDKQGYKISDSSLSKDASCILRMYVEQPRKKQINEETLDCPFVELGLIQKAGDSRHYGFRLGSKSNLPSAVVVAAALEYVATLGTENRSLSISRLTYEGGSPGLAFKLTESAICQAIEEVNSRYGMVSLTDSAGLMQMSFQERPEKISLKLLDRYFSK